MSSETITTAIFLITTVVAASVLVMAIFPVISSMTGTFASTTHESDVRIRTDFKIIATYASSGTQTAQIWMKNIGSERISSTSIRDFATVLCGSPTNFGPIIYDPGTADGYWTYTIIQTSDNGFWDPGETMEVTCVTPKIPASPNYAFFQFTLANGIWRSTEFTVSP
jgi:flagellar protein FlaG